MESKDVFWWSSFEHSIHDELWAVLAFHTNNSCFNCRSDNRFVEESKHTNSIRGYEDQGETELNQFNLFTNSLRKKGCELLRELVKRKELKDTVLSELIKVLKSRNPQDDYYIEGERSRFC